MHQFWLGQKKSTSEGLIPPNMPWEFPGVKPECFYRKSEKPCDTSSAQITNERFSMMNYIPPYRFYCIFRLLHHPKNYRTHVRTCVCLASLLLVHNAVEPTRMVFLLTKYVFNNIVIDMSTVRNNTLAQLRIICFFFF